MLPLFAKRPASRRAAPKRRAHVAVCPFPESPHTETFFLLCRRIAAAHRDVQVSMFTTVAYSMGLYNYWDWDPEADENLHFLAAGEWPPTNATQAEATQIYLEGLPENLRRSMSQAEEEFGKITYVVADAFLADVCRGIADERGIGWSAVWTSSVTSLAAFMHGDEIQRKINESNPSGFRPDLNRPFHQPADHWLPGFPAGVITAELPQGTFSGPDQPFDQMFRGMVRSLPKADTVLVDSFNHLESSVASALLGPNTHLGGLFSLTLPFPSNIELDDIEGMLPWLDARPSPGSVIYINLGVCTIHAQSPTETQQQIKGLAEALEETGIPFLWYVVPTWPRIEFPEGFVERTSKSGQGKVVTRTWGMVTFLKLEREVVRHKAVGAQLRETPWWAVSEGMAAGKPTICIARHNQFDQALNTALVDRVWGVGIVVEDNTLMKDRAMRALRRVMVEDEGRKIKAKAAAVGKLAKEDAAEPHGSSAKALNKFMSFVTK